MAYQIYCGKGFDTQKAERFFKERRIAYQRVDVLKYGIGRRELESVAAAVGLDALCDKESKAYRESVIAYTQSRDSILAGLMEKPQLLRLPIVRDGRRATVGYCPEIWEEWLKGYSTGVSCPLASKMRVPSHVSSSVPTRHASVFKQRSLSAPATT